MALTATAALNKDLRNANGATMEHRHLAVVAGIIADIPDEAERVRMADYFAKKLSTTNPRFSRSRFLAACKG